MKKLITLLLLLICTTTFADNKQNKEVSSINIDQKQTIVNLQNDVVRLEKDVDTYKDMINNGITIIGIIIGLGGIIFTALNIFIPLSINKRREKEIDENIKRIDIKVKEIDQRMEEMNLNIEKLDLLEKEFYDIKAKVEESERKAAKSEKESNINKLFSEAYNEKDNIKAIKKWSDIIILDPKSLEAYYNRAILYGKSIETRAEALYDYTKIIELYPKEFLAYNNRADLYRQKKEFDNAIKDCEKALDIDSSDFCVLDTMGHIYLDMAKYDEAIDYFNRAININPSSWESYAKRGKAYEELAKIENDPIKKEDYEKKSKEDIDLAKNNGFNIDDIV